ncbi:iron chelate uptake ABC transporter family permease subunit [Nocardioides sp. AE5]|uniref:iron chelate uptake ABC transporter family permease subunit n=1 Tax=Nocardioides sp. AE5 TaxID=2962573 RepID=UPI002881995F|nr:iron chelate uptake ABC transporter family permease subunit [Nocardioides sp. AE5]MDT0203075.1 iron chelate uptake ABC transporter family permease subunit [Nocardioides sp. AE5]
MSPSFGAPPWADDLAVALGAGVRLTRTLSFIAITLICGASTAVVGPILFVGLKVPHVARAFVGPDPKWIIVTCLVLGPLLFVVADMVGRVIVPSELPVGLVTSFIGAPVLIWLTRRGRRPQHEHRHPAGASTTTRPWPARFRRVKVGSAVDVMVDVRAASVVVLLFAIAAAVSIWAMTLGSAGLGMKNADALDALESAGSFANVPLEKVGLFDVDIAVIVPIGFTTAELEQDTLLNSLDVVKDGRAVVIDPDSALGGAWAAASTLSIQVVLEDLAPQLAAAAERL